MCNGTQKELAYRTYPKNLRPNEIGDRTIQRRIKDFEKCLSIYLPSIVKDIKLRDKKLNPFTIYLDDLDIEDVYYSYVRWAIR